MTWSRLYATALLGPLAEQLIAAASVGPGMRVLDVLAGDGVLTRRLAEAVHPGEAAAEDGNIVSVERVIDSEQNPTIRVVSRRGSVTAVVPDAAGGHALTAELRSAHVDADVVVAPPGSLPFDDGQFDVALSLLRITASNGGDEAFGELRRVARRALAVVQPHDRLPTPERLLALAWQDVRGEVPAALRAPQASSMPSGWRSTPVRDVLRFDSARQLTDALLEHLALAPAAATAEDALDSALRARFAQRLGPFEAADGTLRIPVDALLVTAPSR